MKQTNICRLSGDINDKVYGAVSHRGVVIARVQPVHSMNAEQRQTTATSEANQFDLDRWSASIGVMVSTFTIAVYYFSALKLILILRSHMR